MYECKIIESYNYRQNFGLNIVFLMKLDIRILNWFMGNMTKWCSEYFDEKYQILWENSWEK